MSKYTVEAVLKATGVNDFVNSMDRAGKSVDSLNKGGQKVSASVGSILKAVGITKALSASFDMVKNSVGGAIERFDTLNNFPRVMEKMGFSAEQSTKAINRLSEGTDGLPTTLDGIAKVTQRITSMTGDLDGAVETSLALNNAFIASGASTADASRGLEQYVQMLSKGSVDLQSWRTLQETMPYALQKTAEAFGYTGESAQNDFYDALKNGEISMSEFNDKLIELSEGTGGFAEVARESTGGIATAWSRLQTAVARNVEKIIRTIDELLTKNGLPNFAQMIDMVRGQVDKWFGAINKILPTLVANFKSLANSLEPIAPAIKIAMSAFVAFLSILTLISGFITHILPAIKSLGAVFVFLTNPITLVILAISALVGVMLYLYKTNEEVAARFNDNWNNIKSALIPIIEGISSAIKRVWGSLIQWWVANNEQIQGVVTTVWNFVSNTVTAIVSSVVSFVKEIWGTLVDWWAMHGDNLMTTHQMIWNGILSVIQTVMPIITAIIKVAWTVISFIVEMIWENIKGVISGALNVILGLIGVFTSIFTGDWANLWESIKQLVFGAVEFIWNAVQLLLWGRMIKGLLVFANMFRTGVASMWETIKIVFLYAIDFIKNIFTNGVGALGTTATRFQSLFVQGVRFMWTTVQNIFTTVLNVIRGIFSGNFSVLQNIATTSMNFIRSIITSSLNAIRMLFTNTMRAIGTVVDTVFNAIGNVVIRVMNSMASVIGSSLRAILNLFRSIFNAVASAVRNGMNNAKSAVSSILNQMKSILSGAVASFMSIGADMIRGLVNGIRSMAGAAINAAKGVVSDAISGAKALLGIRSPSRVFKEIGAFTSQGLALGIDKDAHKAVSSVHDMATSMTSAFNPNLDYNSELNSQLSSANVRSMFDHNITLADGIDNTIVVKTEMNINGAKYEAFVRDISNEINNQDKRGGRFNVSL